MGSGVLSERASRYRRQGPIWAWAVSIVLVVAVVVALLFVVQLVYNRLVELGKREELSLVVSLSVGNIEYYFLESTFLIRKRK